MTRGVFDVVPQREAGRLAFLLERVAKQRLVDVVPQALAELAVELWYGQTDVLPVLSSVVDALDERVHKQRALYVIDRLRRFSCMDAARAAVVKAYLEEQSHLKLPTHSPDAAQRVSQYKLDKLAYAWGLEEDVSRQLQHVLKFQTRHYAARLSAKVWERHVREHLDTEARSLTDVAGGALRTFFNMAACWGLTDEDCSILLAISSPTLHRWRADPERAQPERETLERLSYLFNIWTDLQVLLPDARAADAWIKRPNDNPIFGDGTPLALMCTGNVPDLESVARYTRSWREMKS